MKMIIVTRKNDGARAYVNPENICAVYPYYNDKDTTAIQFPGSDDNFFRSKRKRG